MERITVTIAFVVLVAINISLVVTGGISFNGEQVAEKPIVTDSLMPVVPDTLTFEQEMAILDSAIKAQYGVVYDGWRSIPNVDIIGGNTNYQTIVRHKNGMPKFVVQWKCLNRNCSIGTHIL